MPFGAIAAAAVPSVVNFAASTASGIGARRRQREQNEANRRLADEQAAYNLAQWDRVNAYNHPQQQMDRFREAGLNPNLIYGTGTASAGLADAVKGKERPEAVGVENPLESLGRYQGTYMNKVKTDNIKAQTEVAHQDRVNKSLQALGITFDNRNKAVKAGIGERTADYLVEAQEYETKMAYERQRGLHEDVEQKILMNPKHRDEIDKRITKIKAETNLAIKRQELIQLQLDWSARGLATQFIQYIQGDETLMELYNQIKQ